MALLLLFAALWHRERLVVAHLEHGIRGEASLADARFVEEWARRLALPFEMERGNVLGRREKGESVEAAARRIRYAFLDDVRRRRGARWVATAHTLDDQAESVLHHILRGTGLRGLAGIAEVRAGFVRPLLRLGGEALRRMLRDSGVAWCEDATNLETTYLRNRLRREVLPYLAKTVNENALAHLAALGEDAAEVEALRRRRTEALLPTLRADLPYGKCVWRVAAARRLESYDLRHALRDEGERLGLPLLSRRRLEELARLLCTSGTWRFQWSGEEELLCGGGFLCWGNRSMLVPPPEARLELKLCPRPNRAAPGGTLRWGTWRVRWTLEILETSETSAPPTAQEPMKTLESLETQQVLPAAPEAPTAPAVSVVLRSVEHLDLAPEEKARVPWWCRPGTPAVLLPGRPPLIPLWHSPQDTPTVPTFAPVPPSASDRTPAPPPGPVPTPDSAPTSGSVPPFVAEAETDTPAPEADASAARVQLFCFASFRNHARITRFSVVLEQTSE
jgi:tRNA(Ile)-lysidine synthetase-like protein